MKINLLVNSTETKPGFLNIDPLAQPSDKTKVPGDPANLDLLVDPAEVTEFVAHGVLQLYPPNMVGNVLDHWVSRLAHGGTITLSATDLDDVARATANGVLSLEQANEFLYGREGERRCGMTVNQVSSWLEGKGLKVLQKKVINHVFYVTAQRP